MEVVDNVEKLVSMYAPLFDGGLGTIKGVVLILSSHHPTVLKPRPIPFALKEKITDKLKRLRLGHACHSNTKARWYCLTIRICGDFMVTLNRTLDLPKYPMPTAEKLSLPLNSGEMFLKLDLSSACQQVLSYEEFGQYVTIGTVSL